MWTSQSTPAQWIFAHFVRIIPCAKARSVTLTDFFVALTVTNGEQKISPKSDLKKIIFINSGHCRPNSFRLPRSGSGISICSKYVGITRSLAVRTLGIPNLLKCINKAKPEPCYKNTAPEPCLRKQRAPEPEPLHFYKSSAALVYTKYPRLSATISADATIRPTRRLLRAVGQSGAKKHNCVVQKVTHVLQQRGMNMMKVNETHDDAVYNIRLRFAAEGLYFSY